MKDSIPNNVATLIKGHLVQIEREENVRILFACESGSRAWGFESTDSDFDVRFVYVRPEDWYFAIDVERKRDVIERPIDNDLDISGWDLRKALQLLRKSNPPLLEWFGSPITYRSDEQFVAEFRALAEPCYSARACFHHYLSMAKGNVREYLKGEEVRRKKYLYVLRPLMAVRWIETCEGMPPTEFQSLVESTVDDEAVRSAINELVAAKRAGRELDWGPKIPKLSRFIDAEFERHAKENRSAPVSSPDAERLNTFFRETVRRFSD